MKVYVVGVGMTRFEKPGRKKDWDYTDYVLEAASKALIDASLTYDVIQFGSAGYCFGDSTCGQRALYQLGLTQIPIVNVNNNCSTGSTALYLARQAIESGLDCVMAVGFEKMASGSLSAAWNDRTNPIDQIVQTMADLRGIENAPLTPQIFANAGIEYIEKFGGNADAFDLIAEKSHNHSTLNPYAQFRQPASLEQVKNARKIVGPLTLLHCSPTSDGAGCAILASEEFVRRHGLMNQAVEIVAQSVATDSILAFDPLGKSKSCIQIAGFGMSQKAAREVYQKGNITPKDIDVVELHDCFSANELITYDALGLCEPGKAADFIANGHCTLPQFYNGHFPSTEKKIIVNPSGGLISKGHPLGATGLAQCAELCWQLRGLAGKRQVKDAKYGLQHNIGLGGASVVTLYKKATDVDPSQNQITVSRFGYNPAVEARGISLEQIKKVMSRSGSLLGTPENVRPEFVQKFITNARQCFRLCRQLCDDLAGTVCITFDCRNHGDRIVDPKRNNDWTSDPPNASFPVDMYSIMMGNVYDIQLLIDIVPSYLALDSVTWGIVGLSLGAHSSLVAMVHEPRLSFAISILGCSDYDKLLEYRAKAAGVPAHLSTLSDAFRLFLKDHDPINRIDYFVGKSLLLISGFKDQLVPPILNQKFIQLLNQRCIDCEEMIDMDAGHSFTPLMAQKVIEWLVKHF